MQLSTKYVKVNCSKVNISQLNPSLPKKGGRQWKNKAIDPFKISIILENSCFVFLFVWSKFLKVYLRVREKSLCFEAGSPVNTFHPLWVNFIQEKPNLKHMALILQFDWRSSYRTLLSTYFFWFVWLLQNGNRPYFFDSWASTYRVWLSITLHFS